MKRPESPNGREYYYLEGVKPVGAHVSELKRDIDRGVKTLKDSAYMISYGATTSSLSFLLVLSNLVGRQNLVASKAELVHKLAMDWRLHVTLTSGHTLIFTGVSGGYFGEGTRGCHDILKFFGFSQKQCTYPFEKQKFTCIKKKTN